MMVKLQALLIVIYHCVLTDANTRQIQGRTQFSLTKRSWITKPLDGFFLRNEYICRAAWERFVHSAKFEQNQERIKTHGIQRTILFPNCRESEIPPDPCCWRTALLRRHLTPTFQRTRLKPPDSDPRKHTSSDPTIAYCWHPYCFNITKKVSILHAYWLSIWHTF